MLKNEDEKYFTFKRNLILRGTANQTLNFRRCEFYFDRFKNCLDFSTTLRNLEQLHPSLRQSLENTQLFYIDEVQERNQFLGNYPLEQQVQVPFDNWQDTTITIACRNLIQKTKKSDDIKQIKSIKKSKEKTIAQAKAYIQQSKRQYKKNQERQKPLSKIGVAKNIGINKKTLEDYSRCLKLGEKFGFDFQHRSIQKISILRKFVKEQRMKSKPIELALQDPDIFWERSEIINKNGPQAFD